MVLVTGKNISINSGTLRMILKAHRAAFFRMYALEDLTNFSTSGAKSRAISTEAMEPSVHNAKPAKWNNLYHDIISIIYILLTYDELSRAVQVCFETIGHQ